MVALAAVLGIIAALIGLFNGLPTSYRLTRKVLSDKGENEAENKLKKFIEYLEWVQQKKQEEVTRRIDSKCRETSLKADLKPLEGELEKSWSTVGKWNQKNSRCKRLESEKYIEIWEKSENTIAQRLQEFSSYTRRYEKTQHTGQITKPATQHTDKEVNTVIKGNVIYAHNLNLIPDKAVNNVIVEGNVINAQNLNLIPWSPTLTENGNGNRSLMESGEVLCPITKENVEKRNNGKPENKLWRSLYNLSRRKENVEKRNNGKPEKIKECEKQERKENMEKRNNGKPEKIKECETREEGNHAVPQTRTKVEKGEWKAPKKPREGNRMAPARIRETRESSNVGEWESKSSTDGEWESPRPRRKSCSATDTNESGEKEPWKAPKKPGIRETRESNTDGEWESESSTDGKWESPRPRRKSCRMIAAMLNTFRFLNKRVLPERP